MSDAPLPPSEPAHSVVIDEHATVPVKRWPIWVAIGGVLAFIAFTVIWYAVDGDDEYEPGVAAQAMLDSAAADGFDWDPSDAELQCIDRVAKGLDPAVFDDAMNPLGENIDDPEQAAVIGKMVDECFERDTRIDMFVWNMVEEEGMTDEQARCVAEAMDDAIMAAGGYAEMVALEDAPSALVVAIFAAYDTCGADPFGDI